MARAKQQQRSSKRKRTATARSVASKKATTDKSTAAAAAKAKPKAKGSRGSKAVESDPSTAPAAQGVEMDMEVIEMYTIANAYKVKKKDINNALKLKADGACLERLRALIVSAGEHHRAELDYSSWALASKAEDVGVDQETIAEIVGGEADEVIHSLQDAIIFQLQQQEYLEKETPEASIDLAGNEETPLDEAQEDELDAMPLDKLIEKAEELGANPGAMDDAMELSDDAQRARLCEIIRAGDDAKDDEEMDEAMLQKIMGLSYSNMRDLRRKAEVDERKWSEAMMIKDAATRKKNCGTIILRKFLTLGEEDMEAMLEEAGIKDDSAAPVIDGDLPAGVVDDMFTVARTKLSDATYEKNLEVKKQHMASAKMIQVVMESGGGLPRASATPAAGFDRSTFKQALKSSDKKTWTQMLADNAPVVEQMMGLARGKSETLNELYRGAQEKTDQGAASSKKLTSVAWVDMEPVKEPARDWVGVRPRTESKKIPAEYRNVFLPLQFDRERDEMMSDVIDDIDESAGISKYDSETVKDEKRKDAFKKARKKHAFKCTQDFRDATDKLEDYCSNTVPPLMPVMSEDLKDHRQYVRELVEEMKLAGANDDPKIMKIYLRYDEQVRFHKARATVEVSWTDNFVKLKHAYVETPERQLRRAQQVETQLELKRLREQVKAKPDKARPTKKTRTHTAATDATGDTGGAGLSSSDKSIFRMHFANVDGAQEKHFFLGQDRKKGVCRAYSKGGCSRTDCKFSHHCMKCGEAGHSTTECTQ